MFRTWEQVQQWFKSPASVPFPPEARIDAEMKANDGWYNPSNAAHCVCSWRMSPELATGPNGSQFWCDDKQDLKTTAGRILAVKAIGMSTTSDVKDGEHYRATKIMCHVMTEDGAVYTSKDAYIVAPIIQLMTRYKMMGIKHQIQITIGRSCDRYGVYEVND